MLIMIKICKTISHPTSIEQINLWYVRKCNVREYNYIEAYIIKLPIHVHVATQIHYYMCVQLSLHGVQRCAGIYRRLVFNCEYLLIANCEFYPCLQLIDSQAKTCMYTTIRYGVDNRNYWIRNLA